MMFQTVPSNASNKLAFVLRRRFEFGVTLLLAALLPWAAMRGGLPTRPSMRRCSTTA